LFALVLAIGGEFLSRLIGVQLMGLATSPISGIMLAILLGVLVRNTVSVPLSLQPGIAFGLRRVLRLGVVLLGIRLSLGQLGGIGLQSLPVIAGVVISALLVVTFLARRLGLSPRLGTLIAVGTSICGATAIVATAPAIGAKDNEVSYAVACVALFGVSAMLVYPVASHWLFAGDGFASGLFLGTAVHDTAQVAGAGLVYQQFYNDPRALDVATVTKLIRNLAILIVVPLMSILYHRKAAGGASAPAWWRLFPLFVVGFALMSVLRTVGDAATPAFGLLSAEHWQLVIAVTKRIAGLCLAVAMACVGLGTDLRDIRRLGLKPFAVGLFSALLVGVVSLVLIKALY
jgi:uncharacterized integral membrane protein (TIGR00698 family)